MRAREQHAAARLGEGRGARVREDALNDRPDSLRSRFENQ